MAISKHQFSKQLSGHCSKSLKNYACLETWQRSCLNCGVDTVTAHDGLWKAPLDSCTQAETSEMVKCFNERNFLSRAGGVKYVTV